MTAHHSKLSVSSLGTKTLQQLWFTDTAWCDVIQEHLVDLVKRDIGISE